MTFADDLHQLIGDDGQEQVAFRAHRLVMIDGAGPARTSGSETPLPRRSEWCRCTGSPRPSRSGCCAGSRMGGHRPWLTLPAQGRRRTSTTPRLCSFNRPIRSGPSRCLVSPRAPRRVEPLLEAPAETLDNTPFLVSPLLGTVSRDALPPRPLPAAAFYPVNPEPFAPRAPRKFARKRDLLSGRVVVPGKPMASQVQIPFEGVALGFLLQLGRGLRHFAGAFCPHLMPDSEFCKRLSCLSMFLLVVLRVPSSFFVPLRGYLFVLRAPSWIESRRFLPLARNAGYPNCWGMIPPVAWSSTISQRAW